MSRSNNQQEEQDERDAATSTGLPIVNAAFVAACHDANQRSMLELERLETRRREIRARLGISNAIMLDVRLD
ncbi:hypothetical protein Ae201684P_014067 [Aphanomyces euteiches]|nr:hypothetical protein Ae201684P_014067 [Aphanomyces euteiches]